MYKVEFSSRARCDFTSIIGYIRNELDNATAAEKIRNNIYKAVERLENFAYIGKVAKFDEDADRIYRMVVVQSYIVIYWVDEPHAMINIARIVHSKQNYIETLGDNDE